MADLQALVPVEQREVLFYDDTLTAVRAEDGRVYVVLNHMCEALGLDTQGQSRRVQRHKVLARGYGWVDILSTQGDGAAQRRRAQVLRVDLVPLWLAGVRVSMVREEIRDKLERFQEEAAAVLWEAFQEGRLTMDTAFDQLLESDSDAVQAYRMLQALVKLARNQVLIEARINAQEDRLGVHEGRLDTYEQRLEEIETTLGDPAHTVTPGQAMQISQAVKAVALEMSKQSGRNEYGGVYGELYRRFEITSYKLLPATRFEAAMEWLREWHSSLVGEAPF